jgi:AraC family transcriptional activator of tynA and feaB
VLYDARRPFEDRLFGPEPRVELLIATVPAAPLLRSVPDAERLCAKPIPLSGTVARAIAVLVRDAISRPDTPAKQSEPDIVAYLSAMLRLAAGANHELSRPSLFRLIDTFLRANIAAIRPAPALAAEFGFADQETTFERHVLLLRVELFRNLLRQDSLSDVSITRLALQCGFSDAAHGSRTFKERFGITPRDFRVSVHGPSAVAVNHRGRSPRQG